MLDRPTRAYEHVFLFTKSAKGYYYDIDSMRENYTDDGDRVGDNDLTGRNLRDVWVIDKANYGKTHFATFPHKLVEPCVLLGTSSYGVCSKCGKQWKRKVKVEGKSRRAVLDEKGPSQYAGGQLTNAQGLDHKGGHHNIKKKRTFLGWVPDCKCNAGISKPIILDPFAGSGTAGVVAVEHNREAILCDLSRAYLENHAKKRVGLADTSILYLASV